jgi:methionyl-tRNA formyltransferase
MRVVFIGTGEIGVPTLQLLLGTEEHTLVGVVTQPDKPAGRRQEVNPGPIKATLSGHTIPLLQPRRIKAPEAIEQMRGLAPDLIVVAAYGQILPPPLLQLPRIACLNLHASLLPRWRGASPVQAAIAAGDAETGITVMYMDEGLDTGDILLQRKLQIEPNETGESLQRRLSHAAPGALLTSLQLLSGGKAPRIPQDHALVSYAPKLHRAAGRIEWSEAAEVIGRKIRAYNPWPGSFTAIATRSAKPMTLKIFSAEVVDQRGFPGEILQADQRGLVIATGSGALLLGEVQLEGKRRVSGTEFIRGYPNVQIVTF